MTSSPKTWSVMGGLPGTLMLTPPLPNGWTPSGWASPGRPVDTTRTAMSSRNLVVIMSLSLHLAHEWHEEDAEHEVAQGATTRPRRAILRQPGGTVCLSRLPTVAT